MAHAHLQENASPVFLPGRRVIFDAPRTGWAGVVCGLHINLVGDVLYDLIDVEFDCKPDEVYLCKRSLLELEVPAT